MERDGSAATEDWAGEPVQVRVKLLMVRKDSVWVQCRHRKIFLPRTHILSEIPRQLDLGKTVRMTVTAWLAERESLA